MLPSSNSIKAERRRSVAVVIERKGHDFKAARLREGAVSPKAIRGESSEASAVLLSAAARPAI